MTKSLKAVTDARIIIASEDDKKNLDLERYTSIDDDNRKLKLAVITLAIVFASGLITFFIIHRGDRREIDWSIYIGSLGTIVALVLFVTYFFAFRFYEDIFYLFISIGWVFNALYIPSELFIKKEVTGTFNHAISAHLLALVSSLSFWIALLATHSTPHALSKRKSLYIWSSLISASVILNFYSLKPEMTEGHQFAWEFFFNALIGVCFSAYVLVKIGSAIKNKMHQASDSTSWLLPLSFYLYGALQFASLFRFVWFYHPILHLSLFVAGAAIKILNIVSLGGNLLSVTYPEIAATKRRLEMRSRLEELGAMAASIEHDLKTPLGSMNFSIKTMKDRFQANPEVIKGLNKIEDARNRIAAIARIIPYLTGDKEFYNRDRLMRKTSILEIVYRAMRLVKQEMNIDTNKVFFDLNRKHLFIRAFSPMIEQVMVNIFKNGLEAIHEAGKDRGLIEINISSVTTPDDTYSKWVKVNIKDNGRGIAPDNVPLVTSLFTDRAEKKPNSGIGLFIASKLMDIHEGKIEVQSKMGEWTIVSLLFPEWEAIQKAQEANNQQN